MDEKTTLSENFLSAYEELKNAVLEDFKKLDMPQKVVEWVNTMCDYNVPGGNMKKLMKANVSTGKMNRGLSVLETANTLSKKVLSVEESKAYIALGWCIEFVPHRRNIYDE